MELRISVEGDVFTFINTFHCPQPRQAALITSLRDFTTNVTRHMPGFLGVAIHASAVGDRVINYVQWRSAADMDAMRADPRAQAHMHEVAALADRIEPAVFTVAFVERAG
ncbi:antibiotic biosynthesis monooxygenase family protein [Novosphingobium sp.]|uniref:antibiotic biosynthesis monooxygenase family protein n=1 Tax=Novosphingobium sp. TaxID=1874826 RepID=UPI003BA9BF9B